MSEQQINQLETDQTVFNNETMYGGIRSENPIQENRAFNPINWFTTIGDIFYYAFILWPNLS